ncbi:hypothetical protein KY339_00910 [Candidatus Woesearchaeota archaeon]|nr:hypothetical protein [Candidatus Woesearchaeota archaeon]
MPIDPLFVQGVLKITTVCLSVVAGYLGIKLLIVAEFHKSLKPWQPLMAALLIFAFGEIMGTLDAFGFLYFRKYLVTIETGVVFFLVIALILKVYQLKEEKRLKS